MPCLPRAGACTLFGLIAKSVAFDERTSEELGKQFDQHRNECLTNDFMTPYIK
jgi:hypothetical protein